MVDRFRLEIDTWEIKEPSSNITGFYADDEISMATLSSRDSSKEKLRPGNMNIHRPVHYQKSDDSEIRKQNQENYRANTPPTDNVNLGNNKNGRAEAAAAVAAVLMKDDKSKPSLSHRRSENSLFKKMHKGHPPNPPEYFDTQKLKDKLDAVTMGMASGLRISVRDTVVDRQISLGEFTDAYMHEKSRNKTKGSLTRSSTAHRQRRTNHNRQDEPLKNNDVLLEFRQGFHDMGRNGDGKISWSEFLKLTERIGVKLKAKEMTEVYQTVNESDGQISYKSFIEAYANELKITTSPIRFSKDNANYHRTRRKSMSTTDLTVMENAENSASSSYVHQMPSTSFQASEQMSYRRKKSLSTTDLTTIQSHFSHVSKKPTHQKGYFSGVKTNFLSKTFSSSSSSSSGKSKKSDKKNVGDDVVHEYGKEQYDGKRRTSSSALDLTQTDKMDIETYASKSKQATSNRIDDIQYDGRRRRSSSESQLDTLDSLAASKINRTRQRSIKIGAKAVAPTRDIVKSWLTRHQGNSSSKLKNLLSNELKDYFKCFWISDQDFDGKLSAYEFSKMISRLGMKLNDKDMKKAFDAADTNKDQLISFNEYLNAYFSKNILEVLPPDQVKRQFCDVESKGVHILNKVSCYQLFKQLGNDVNERRLGRIMSFMMADEGVVTLSDFYLYLGLRVL